MRRLAIGAMVFGGVLAFAGMAAAAPMATGQAVASPPNIVVHPRRIEPGPNAKRHCRFWLAKEDRVSGTVIVPRQYCWWR